MIEIKKVDYTLDMIINYYKIPVTITNKIEEFNEVVRYCNENFGKEYFGIERTKSGGISVRKNSVNMRGLRWEVKSSQLGAEIIVLSSQLYRVQFRAGSLSGQKALPGTVAFKKFKEELLKDGIDITLDYIDNGKQIKETIEKPMIELKRQSYAGEDVIFNNANHLDIHNSYPSGAAQYKPAWRKTIERLYYKRKENPINKQILNCSIGYMQSTKYFNAKLADVSKYAIELNNKKIREMSKWLEDTGRVILSYNTDGIWFTGEPTNIHSKQLGEFEEDHSNCTIRFKSKGCYEFIENGKYTPVVRGTTQLDKVKPRDKWEWGDIFKQCANPTKLVLNSDYEIEMIDKSEWEIEQDETYGLE